MHDAPEAAFPRQLCCGPFAGRQAEASRRRGFQPENPFVPQVPGASVEVVPGKGGSHENALAETEIPVSGCRSLIAETGGERLGVRRISLREHPDRESGWSEAELGEVLFPDPFEFPLEAQ